MTLGRRFVCSKIFRSRPLLLRCASATIDAQTDEHHANIQGVIKMNRILRTFAPCALLLCLAAVALADLKVKQKTTTGGQTYESSVMIKGQRERRESAFGGAGGGTSQVSLLQCDLRRTLLINAMDPELEVEGEMHGDAALSEKVRLGAFPNSRLKGDPNLLVMPTIDAANITDTGERRQMFGLTARHLKTKLTIEPAPDACAQDRFRQETDGWYTDFEYGLSCAAAAASAHVGRARPSGCQDRVVTRQTGAGRLGFPLAVTTTYYAPDGQVTSTTTTARCGARPTRPRAAPSSVPAPRAEQKLHALRPELVQAIAHRPARLGQLLDRAADIVRRGLDAMRPAALGHLAGVAPPFEAHRAVLRMDRLQTEREADERRAGRHQPVGHLGDQFRGVGDQPALVHQPVDDRLEAPTVFRRRRLSHPPPPALLRSRSGRPCWS